MLLEAESAFVIEINGLGDFDDPEHDGFFSGDSKGKVIVPLERAMRFPNEREAQAAGQLTTDTLHNIIHDDNTTHGNRFSQGHTIVTDANGNAAFEVKIKRI